MKRVASRRWVTLLVVACMGVAALLIPAAAHLPHWIEAEYVGLAWWLAWFGVLTTLLYNGVAVDGSTRGPALMSGWSRKALDNLPVADGCAELGCLFGDGCFAASAAIVAVVLFGFAVVIIVEFVIPAIALLLFVSVGGMLARAADDRQGCAASFGRSALWAGIWSTLYVGPVIALAVWGFRLFGKV